MFTSQKRLKACGVVFMLSKISNFVINCSFQLKIISTFLSYSADTLISFSFLDCEEVAVILKQFVPTSVHEGADVLGSMSRGTSLSIAV